MSFIISKRTFIAGEDLVREGELGSDMFYILNGRVAAIQKTSKTYIKDLIHDEYFGEIGFFG